MKLTPITERFILHWGEMGARWGVNRSVAQIHALLYISGQTLPADEIAETLSIARSNVSSSLKELLSWKLVKVSHILGDRRDHYETSQDIWELFKLIVAGRQQREVEPTLAVLGDLLADPDLPDEQPGVRQRILETREFIALLTTWVDEMLLQDPETLAKVLKMGAKIRNLLRGQ
ncbi:MAG: MarR family transcriptional regulator [Zoogloeaceae bacterium]|jgi:DNA-binding transcriptional regulator GbsR (MarR family)|nr:MarR family transcriptional regulator [Zoogloeaceae bacterium]